MKLNPEQQSHLADLSNKLRDLKANEPKLRSRQLAERLGISEVELLTLEADENVAVLTGDFKELLNALKPAGQLMALTRNEACVHERKGVYDNVTFYEGGHNMGVVVNPDIDLRLFMNEWVYALSVTLPRPKGKALHSVQFFNKYGVAVHKIFTTPKTELAAFQDLISTYRTEWSPIIIEDRAAPPRAAETPDEEIAVADFQDEWRNLEDTHHFFGMLKRHGLSRTQALRLAPEGMVTPVARLSVEALLRSAADDEIPIMCFVHSPGCIQIHSGPVRRLLWHQQWFNVMDPLFNLHLDCNRIEAAYVVRKPTVDGQVTSLELYDEAGDLIVYFFGARKPGKPEIPAWRKLCEDIPAIDRPVPA